MAFTDSTAKHRPLPQGRTRGMAGADFTTMQNLLLHVFREISLSSPMMGAYVLAKSRGSALPIICARQRRAALNHVQMRWALCKCSH